MKKLVSVSQLASYCDNQNEFIRLKGGAANIQAAIEGENRHNKVGKSSVVKRILALLVTGGILWLLNMLLRG